MTPQFEARTKKMFELGLVWNGDSFIYKDINFHHTDLTCMSDKNFDKALAGATRRMKFLRDEEEKALLSPEDYIQIDLELAAELKSKEVSTETLCCPNCDHEYDRHIGDECPNCGHIYHVCQEE